MSQEFLKGQKNLFEKFLELNKVSYETNVKGMKATHPYSSKILHLALSFKTNFLLD
jgi:hypothetical protein